MSRSKQVYLAVFLSFCVGLFFLLYCRHAESPPLDCFNLIACLAAAALVQCCSHLFRSFKERLSFLKILPVLFLSLLCLAQLVKTLLPRDSFFMDDPAVFSFYLFTLLGNLALSAVGFFLK